MPQTASPLSIAKCSTVNSPHSRLFGLEICSSLAATLSISS
jgi:hypothetical protein